MEEKGQQGGREGKRERELIYSFKAEADKRADKAARTGESVRTESLSAEGRIQREKERNKEGRRRMDERKGKGRDGLVAA